MSDKNQIIGTIAWTIAGFGALIGGVFAYNKYNKYKESNFAVGRYIATYPGWRKVTKDDLKNRTFTTDLLTAHQENGGWPFLEKFDPHHRLYVDNGVVLINKKTIIPMGFNIYLEIVLNMPNTYQAMSVDKSNPLNMKTEDWLENPPNRNDEWTVIDESGSIKTPNLACLFVKDTYAHVNNPESKFIKGGKKTRRHKKSRSRKH